MDPEKKMEAEKEQTATVEAKNVRQRPMLLTMLCLFSLVYFGLMALLFLAGLFWAGTVTNVMNQYMTTAKYTKMQTDLMFGAGFSMHGLAFTGIIMVWKLRKTGYYLLGIACLIIASYQLLLPSAATASTAVYIFFIFAFGLFFKRLR